MVDYRATTGADPASSASRRATRLVFFAAGFGMGAWAPMVPVIKDRLGINEGTLGLLLLVVGLGSIFAMPIATMLAQRSGCRLVLVVSVLGIALSLPLIAVAPSILTLVPLLLAFGAAVGSADCVVNIQAIQVETASSKKLMSGFHALFSLGALVGAGAITLSLSAGLEHLPSLTLASAVLILAITVAYRGLLSEGEPGEGGIGFRMPGVAIASFALLAFTAALLEGSMLDWGAVFLRDLHGVPTEAAAVGYTVFALAMTVGRFCGDGVRTGYSTRGVVVGGCLIVTVGLGILISSPWQSLAILSFVLIGIGLANLFPALVAEIGNRQDLGGASSVAAVLTAGYGGILTGPAIIGFVAHVSSLVISFAMMIVLLIVAAGVGLRALATR